MRGLVVLILCIWAAQPAAAQRIPLRYGQAYSALQSIFALPVLIAERNGYFVHEGLDFGMIPIPGGGEKLITALHDGRADISHVATPFLIQAVLNGSDAVAIAAEFNNPVYSLLAKPAIGSYADLKGKLVGLAAENGSITLSIRKLLALHGLGREDFRARFVDGTRCTRLFDCRRSSNAVPSRQPQDFMQSARQSGCWTIDRSGTTISSGWRSSLGSSYRETPGSLLTRIHINVLRTRRGSNIRGQSHNCGTTGFEKGNITDTGYTLEPDHGVFREIDEVEKLKG